jgi:cobalt-zinc-cadmium efflux system protein
LSEHDSEAQPTSPDAVKEPKLKFAIALTSVILVGELVGGWWTGSLALLSDAGHVFGDVFALVLALAAFRLSLRPPTREHTFGMHRAEVFAALINSISLGGVSVLIFFEAYERLFAPSEVKGAWMLAVASTGLIVNLIVLMRLRGHGGDINLRGAYLHVLGDLLASVGVVVAAVLIALTGQHIIDPIISVGIGLLILVSGLRLGKQSVHILLEGVPREVDLREVAEAVSELDDVLGIHHVHAWSLCSNYTAASMHVVATVSDPQKQREVHLAVERLLRERFGFSETTIEMEYKTEDGAPLVFPLFGSAQHDGTDNTDQHAQA